MEVLTHELGARPAESRKPVMFTKKFDKVITVRALLGWAIREICESKKHAHRARRKLKRRL